MTGLVYRPNPVSNLPPNPPPRGRGEARHRALGPTVLTHEALPPVAALPLSGDGGLPSRTSPRPSP